MTAMAYEKYATVWNKWVKSNSSWTYDVHTCVGIFSLVDYPSALSTTSEQPNFLGQGKTFCPSILLR